ncbi:MAG: YkgJ family cysteine cluster protein [Candidatus Sericytochromatia bacterium]
MIKITQYIKKIQNSESLDSFYNNLDELNYFLSTQYPQIQCKTGCNRCCKFYGSPEMFDIEWDNIKSYIEKSFTEKDFNRLRKKLNDGFDYYQNNISKSKPESFFECPFIYKGQCSIYQKRPFICRVFGYSKVKSNPLTCNEEIQRFSYNLPYLPDKSELESYLFNREKSPKIRTIIYYLKSYFNINL